MVTRALKVLAVLAVVAGTFVGVAGLFGPGGVEADGHSATRSFDDASVGPGADVEVSISASGLGGFGGVIETLPEGFTYESSSLPESAVSVDGQKVTFAILGNEGMITYTVSAPETQEGVFTFSGVVTDSNRDERAVTGATDVTVGASGSRSISGDVLAGGEVTVSIEVMGLGDFGGVAETLPAGFAFVSTSLDDGQVKKDGQTVTFAIIGDAASFTYKVTASDAAGDYTFAGTITSSNRVTSAVAGDSMVSVEAEEIELPVVEPDLPVTGDAAVPTWLLAVMAAAGALMIAGGAGLARRRAASRTQ